MYYASAETLMLRSIGIPARMAVGFVEGAYDEVERKYTVAYKDSHAWPEVYFPGIGWVEFEPTSNQFPIERPETKNNPDEMRFPARTGENQAATPLPPLYRRIAPNPADEELAFSSADQTTWYQNILVPFLILLTLGLVFSSFAATLLMTVCQYTWRINTSGVETFPPRWLKSLGALDNPFPNRARVSNSQFKFGSGWGIHSRRMSHRRNAPRF